MRTVVAAVTGAALSCVMKWVVALACEKMQCLDRGLGLFGSPDMDAHPVRTCELSPHWVHVLQDVQTVMAAGAFHPLSMA